MDSAKVKCRTLAQQAESSILLPLSSSACRWAHTKTLQFYRKKCRGLMSTSWSSCQEKKNYVHSNMQPVHNFLILLSFLYVLAASTFSTFLTLCGLRFELKKITKLRICGCGLQELRGCRLEVVDLTILKRHFGFVVASYSF